MSLQKNVCAKNKPEHTHIHPPNNLVVMWLQEITDQPKNIKKINYMKK